MTECFQILLLMMTDRMSMKRFQYSEDLLDVGVSKALGYLPLSTIEEYGGDDALSSLIYGAYEAGNEAKIFDSGTTGSGALYVWNAGMLQFLLDKYRDVLTQAGVPVTVFEYVWHVEHHLVDSRVHPEAYMVVGITFNDPRFTGKDLKDAKDLVEYSVASGGKRNANK